MNWILQTHRPVLAVILALSIVLMAAGAAHGWRNYGRFRLGAEAAGIGGAYVADASSELAFSYNPAGLVQVKKTISAMWEGSTTIRIYNILGSYNVRLDHYDYISFFSVLFTADKLRFGPSLSTVFYSFFENNRDLSVRSLMLSAAYPVLENLSLGLGAGTAIANEQTGYGFGLLWNIGLLWKPMDSLQVGACIHSPFSIDWIQPVGVASLSESFPAILELGAEYSLSEKFLAFLSLDYVFIDAIRYTVNGEDASPVFDANIFARLHPHAGIRFLEELTGAHISLGFMMDSNYYGTGSVNQYLLTAGLRFYGKNMIFSGSLVDAMLIGLFYSGNIWDEQFNVTFSYQIL